MDYVKSMVLFRRRCSDPSPQLVSLSPLEDCDNTSNSSLCISDTSETPKKQNIGLTTWSKKVGQKWDKLRRNNSSELLSGRRRHWSPIRMDVTNTNNKVFRSNSTRKPAPEIQTVELIADYKKLYEVYKDAVAKKTEIKNLKGKRRIKSLTGNLGLSEQQFLDYLLLIKPNSQEELKALVAELSEQDRKITSKKMESLSENSSCNSKTKKFKSVKNIFARLSSKSDDESEEHYQKKKSVSSNSLPSLSEFLSHSKKTISLTEMSNLLSKSRIIKSDESGYGSDSTAMNSPRESIKSETSNVSGDDLSFATSSVGTSKLNKSESRLSKTNSSNYYSGNKIDEKKDGGLGKKEYKSKFRLSMHLKRPRSECSAAIESNSKRFNESTSPVKKTPSTPLNKASQEPSMEEVMDSFNSVGLTTSSGKDKKLNSLNKDNSLTALTLNDLSSNEKGSTLNKSNLTVAHFSNDLACNMFNPFKLDNLIFAYPSSTLQSTNTYLTNTRMEQEFKCVRVKVGFHERIGIMIGTKSDSGRYVITDITPGCAAERNGNLKIDDEIVKINGTRLRGMPFTFAISTLSPVNGELEIVVSREVPFNEKNKTSFTPFSSISSTTYIKPSNCQSSGQHNEPSNGSATCNRFLKSPDNTNNVPLTGMKKFSFPSESSKQSSAAYSSSTVSPVSPLVVVDFKKGIGMKSLGFTIVGGRDTPKKPMDLYVKTIFLDGQAAENGLKRGDKLVSINGTSFHGLTHRDAVNMFKSIKFGNIELVVERGHRNNM